MRHIRGTQNIVSDVLSRTFESSLPEGPNQVACLLALTTFPLAFQELGQIQRQDSVLAGIISKADKDDKVYNYACFVVPAKADVKSLWPLLPQYRRSSPIFTTRR